MFDDDRLLVIVEQGESLLVEFKKSLSLSSEGLKSLCGMLNAEHRKGTILFGVSPESEVVGLDPGNLDKAQRSLCQKISSGFDPPIVPEVSIIKILGKNVLVLCSARLRAIPIHEYDGRAYIREGTTTRRLSLAEKRALVRSRDRSFHTGPWKCDGCGSYTGMLSIVRITNAGIEKSYRCHCGGEYWPAA